MFEKEAEEYTDKYNIMNEDLSPKSPRHIVLEVFKASANFGYNKANEWHKVADGDLPSEEGGWVCNQNGLPCFFDWGTEQWLDCEGTQIRTTEWCHMPHKE